MEYTKELRCGCVIRRNDTILDYWVDYCPLHKSASDLYEALNLAFSDLAENGRITEPIEQVMKEAIAKVEEKR